MSRDAHLVVGVVQRIAAEVVPAGKRIGSECVLVRSVLQLRFGNAGQYTLEVSLGLRVAVLDAAGNEIAPFTAANCEIVSTDSTIQPIRWKGIADLARLAGKPVRFRVRVEPGLLGGVVARVGDTVIDGTVNRRLESVREALLA